MKDEEEKGSLLFPPWKLMGRFLLVTMILMLTTGISFGIVVHFYIKLTPEWGGCILFLVAMTFFIINFRVTRGSFFCANILKYYALFLVFISLPAFFIGGGNVFILINTSLTLMAFFLISGETYQKLVQYQHDFFEDIKEAREIVEKEMERAHKNKRRR